MILSGKKVAVLGFGVEGESVARFLEKNNALITVLDEKDRSLFESATIEHLESRGISFVFGNFPDLTNFDVIFRSPGIKLSHLAIARVREKKIPITSATKLFFDACPGKIIGVTGTKGKGTTATLIYDMLKKEGKDAYLGGNIGNPPLDFLDKLNENSWVVLELSSFQLHDLDKSPHIAVLLMITSEHLDYHKDTQEYIEAKRNLVRFQTPQDFAVINRDYPASNESDVYTNAKVVQVSRERGTLDDGCFVKDGAIWIRVNGKESKIVDTKEIQIPGKHNWENASAAAMAATLAGVAPKTIAEVLKTFKGLPHRIEFVGVVRGARYFDDSFSTVPETAIAAIESFEEPEILILGGSSKNSDFTELGRVISDTPNIKTIIGIGLEWAQIKEKIHNPSIKIIEGAKTMREIVLQAYEIADPGDVVLLSPACASFDMFPNYKVRGQQFKEEVLKLAKRN